MALADYYARAAVAASQVIAGFDEQAFHAALEGTCVGLSFDCTAAERPEGRALLDLTVRLLARLYPAIALRPAAGAEELAKELAELAAAINPAISLGESAEVGIAVGLDASPFYRTVFTGSDGWTARVSATGSQAVGDSPLPFGAGAAACLAAGRLFRIVLLDETNDRLPDAVFSCLDSVDSVVEPDLPAEGWLLDDPAVLVGCGAIGEAAVWVLARSPLRGELFLVDGETVELSNMQRYVLTDRSDETAVKTSLAAAHLRGELVPRPYHGEWAGFTAEHGHRWATVLVAVDSAAARREVQASLPQWIVNGWTQPGDLGVSTHAFLTDACLSCLYLPDGPGPSEDAIVAGALGVMDRVVEVRTLLYSGGPVSGDLLDAIAGGLGVARDGLDAFEGLPIRQLYVRGVCGGEVLPLGTTGAPRQDVHVPLAHQSALAGVILAARLARRAAGLDTGRTEITRLNILKEPGREPTQHAAKDPRGICICQDHDYQAVFVEAWPEATA